PNVVSGVEVHAIVYDASGGTIFCGGTERVGDLTPNSRTRGSVPVIASAPPAEGELYARPRLPFWRGREKEKEMGQCNGESLASYSFWRSWPLGRSSARSRPLRP